MKIASKAGIIIACFVFLMVLPSCSRETVPKSKIVSWVDPARREVPGGLKKAFVKYWDARSRLDWDSTYRLEAPHVRWLLSLDDYFARHRMAGKPKKVVVKRMIRLYPGAVELEMDLVLEDARTLKDETYTPRDYWIELSGRWYHVEKNPLLRFF